MNCYLKGSKITISSENVVIHLAGKAHDLKNVSSFDEYYKVNAELTKEIFDAFLTSEAIVFISSIKAIVDEVDGELTEDIKPNPINHYGMSKLLAEQYILSELIPKGNEFMYYVLVWFIQTFQIDDRHQKEYAYYVLKFLQLNLIKILFQVNNIYNILELTEIFGLLNPSFYNHSKFLIELHNWKYENAKEPWWGLSSISASKEK